MTKTTPLRRKVVKLTTPLRATDRWKLSLHESVESVRTIAPEAEEVNKEDRKGTASCRKIIERGSKINYVQEQQFLVLYYTYINNQL